jgi:hypothetical protein
MKSHEQELAKSNLAGLASPVQQGQMKLLLAGAWPPLKPLPVFKYETPEYRASIDFDKIRGEWVCRKTSLPSNSVQELRGGLIEIMQALSGGHAAVFAESTTSEQQEQELEKDGTRRLQAMLEWLENYENGLLYSGWRNFLTKSQQTEIEESIRLTLTARQLQCCPKNISYVFDSLSNVGGKLATLIEIAQQNKREQGMDVPAQTKREAASPDAEDAVPFEVIPPEDSASATELLAPSPVEKLIPATLESFGKEPVGSVLPEPDQLSALKRIENTEPPPSEIVTPEILAADLPLLVDDLQEEAYRPATASDFGPRVRGPQVESSRYRNRNSPPYKHVLEISGMQVGFAFVFFLAVIALAVGLTVERGPLGMPLWGTRESMPSVSATPPALANRSGEPPSTRTFNPLIANTIRDSDNLGANKFNSATPSEEKSGQGSRNLESSTRVPSKETNSSAAPEVKPSITPGGSLARNGSAGPIAPPTANPKTAYSSKAAASKSGAPGNPAPPKLASAMGVLPHSSPPSAILVTAPARGSKPFRVTFPEKPIAASSSIAMTSELSLLIVPQPGPFPAHKPARLQPGELVYFVWPRYSITGNRYGSADTIKVRATIGLLGQVQDVKLLDGSRSLLPATISAIRQWRYKPTLLDNRPVQVKQVVTIEFRPSQYLSQVRRPHPLQK